MCSFTHTHTPQYHHWCLRQYIKPYHKLLKLYEKGLEREREREKREKERECGAVGATSTPSTVGLFSFLNMLFLPTISQH